MNPVSPENKIIDPAVQPSPAKVDADREGENLRQELLASIDVRSVVVSAGRFTALTLDGGSLAITRSPGRNKLTITKVLPKRGPACYVGRAPRDHYLTLLREVLAPLAKGKPRGN